MVLRVKPTLTRFPTNNLYTPMDNTPLHSISSVCHPCGTTVVVLIIMRMRKFSAAYQLLGFLSESNLLSSNYIQVTIGVKM